MIFPVLDKVILFIFVCYVCCFGCVFGEDTKKETSDKAHSNQEGMWFGPRLGKRSLRLSSEEDRQLFYKLLEAADAVKYYYGQLPENSNYFYDAQPPEQDTQVSKKVIFTPKLGRSLDDRSYENVDFTPRLGRRLTDEITGPVPEQVYREPIQIDNRNKYFSPRLGRTMNFSPRLGRDLTFDMYPKIRVLRSTSNKIKS